jgi:capsular polysaccharide biosynthesis protein
LDRPQGTRRLYISRSQASTRRVLNEEEIVALLKREGFEVATPENLDFAGQVQLFSAASIIVAPHGAGLANLLFSPRGTVVVELMSPSYVNPCYYSLCGAIGQRYACVFGTTQRREAGPDRETMGDDINVTAELVTRAIQALSA